jgi:hypothetical protein
MFFIEVHVHASKTKEIMDTYFQALSQAQAFIIDWNGTDEEVESGVFERKWIFYRPSAQLPQFHSYMPCQSQETNSVRTLGNTTNRSYVGDISHLSLFIPP